MNKSEIIERNEQLKEMLSELDERLEDFLDLIDGIISYRPDYSMESVKYVELVLKQMGSRIEDDREIQRDASFYVGETIARNEPNARWEVYDGPASDYVGLPCVRTENKIFFPFIATQDFIQNPEIGFYFNEIRDISQL